MLQPSKRRKLEKSGWKIGGSDDFLGLTPTESAGIEIKQTFHRSLKERRRKKTRTS